MANFCENRRKTVSRVEHLFYDARKRIAADPDLLSIATDMRRALGAFYPLAQRRAFDFVPLSMLRRGGVYRSANIDTACLRGHIALITLGTWPICIAIPKSIVVRK